MFARVNGQREPLDDAVAHALGQKMLQFTGCLDGPREQQPVQCVLINQFVKPLCHVFQMPMHVHIGFVLEASLRKDMIGPACLDVSHGGGRQRVVVFRNLTDKDGEQPGMSLINE